MGKYLDILRGLREDTDVSKINTGNGRSGECGYKEKGTKKGIHKRCPECGEMMVSEAFGRGSSKGSIRIEIHFKTELDAKTIINLLNKKYRSSWKEVFRPGDINAVHMPLNLRKPDFTAEVIVDDKTMADGERFAKRLEKKCDLDRDTKMDVIGWRIERLK